ncbi:hypothetical protein B0H11DRAFT_771003 [Mycena galericulata]|nr:hypothetical protein B0H11DRAFT_771003 [Mycena galericulata]
MYIRVAWPALPCGSRIGVVAWLAAMARSVGSCAALLMAGIRWVHRAASGCRLHGGGCAFVLSGIGARGLVRMARPRTRTRTGIVLPVLLFNSLFPFSAPFFSGPPAPTSDSHAMILLSPSSTPPYSLRSSPRIPSVLHPPSFVSVYSFLPLSSPTPLYSMHPFHRSRCSTPSPRTRFPLPSLLGLVLRRASSLFPYSSSPNQVPPLLFFPSSSLPAPPPYPSPLDASHSPSVSLIPPLPPSSPSPFRVR